MSGHREGDTDSVVVERHSADILVESHRAFLRYLERRTGNRALAEDLLQEAFVRNLDRFASVPEEALVPWFYRVLRNAAIDRHRRHGCLDCSCGKPQEKRQV